MGAPSGGGGGSDDGGRAGEREAAAPPESSGALEPDRVAAIEAFARGLARIDLTFLLLRDELYGGSWEEVEADLRARLAGLPYIFKLAERIEDSLERIGRLSRFEAAHGVDLKQVAEALGLDPQD